jgi:hypothetical protein
MKMARNVFIFQQNSLLKGNYTLVYSRWQEQCRDPSSTPKRAHYSLDVATPSVKIARPRAQAEIIDTGTS